MALLDQAKPVHDPDVPGWLSWGRAEADGSGPGGPGSAFGCTAAWIDADEDQCGRPAAAAGGGGAGEADDAGDHDGAADFDCGVDAAGSNWTSPDEALPLLKEANSYGMTGFPKQANQTFYFAKS